MTNSLSATAPRVEVKEWQRELEEMSAEEQLKALRDLYGEAKPIDETPELLQRSMDELQISLESVGDRDCFLEAQNRVPEVVNSFDFRLMFLRAVRFDSELAAQRMVMYWEYKVKLFGPEIAFRQGGKIFLSDLSDDDLATLDAKGLFWLPKDEAGRGVMFSRRQHWSFRHASNLIRLAWYLVHVALEDVSVQKNGVVCIMYNVGSYSISENFNRKGLNMLLQVARRALPFRVVGVHHCYTSKIYNIILPFILSCLGREIRSRHRLHFDSKTMLANILKFGLSADSLPVIMGGKLESDPAAWKEERRMKEQGFVH